MASACSGFAGSRTTISKRLPARSPNRSGRPARPSTSSSAFRTSGRSSAATLRTEKSCWETARLSFVPAQETRSREMPSFFESESAKSFVSHSRRVARKTSSG